MELSGLTEANITVGEGYNDDNKEEEAMNVKRRLLQMIKMK